MRIQLVRQANTCTGGTQFYRCSKGPFLGCCSVDPCDTGVCPDDNNSSTSTTTGAATTKSAASETASQTVSRTTLQTSPAATTTGVGATIIPHNSTAASSATDTSSPDSSSKGALIGGVVGGILGGLLLIGLIIGLIYWRREKKGQKFTLVRWRDLHNEKGGVDDGPDDTSTAERFAGGSLGGSYKDSAKRQSTAPSDNSTAVTKRESNGSPSLISPTVTALSSNPSRRNSAMPSLPSMSEEDPYPLLASTPLIPSTELPGSTPGQTVFTPELPDTPRKDMPAELAADPQRELADIPPPLRINNSNNETNQWAMSTNPIHNQPPLVMTPDGAIMRANLNQSQYSLGGEGGATASAAVRQSASSTNSRRHVMSFMHYDGYDGDHQGTRYSSLSQDTSTGLSQRSTTTPVPQINVTPPMADATSRETSSGAGTGSNPRSRSDVGLGLGLSGTETGRAP